MYEAIIRINDASRAPIKLDLYFCPALAKDLNWHHEEQVIIRFEGTSERWAGKIGIRPPHNPYLWTNVVPVRGLDLRTWDELPRPMSELLHLYNLKPRDRVPVKIDQNGDLVLGVKRHQRGGVSKGDTRPARHYVQRRGRRLGSHSSRGDVAKTFPFGNRKAIEELAEAYWDEITPLERDAERNKIPQIVEDARDRGYLQRDEFVTLASWKSKRPIWRYVRNNSGFIRRQTQKALAVTHRDEALVALDALDGVALRTATAILHWFRPTDTPILDQRVVAALGRISPSNWEDIGFYRDVAGEVVREAGRVGVDLRVMDRALWKWDRQDRRS